MHSTTQLYSEGPQSTFVHNGARFSVDKLLELTRGREHAILPLSDLAWQLDGITYNIHRINHVDFTIPIIVCVECDQYSLRYTICDGRHRAKKKLILGSRIVRAILISPAELGEAFIGFCTQ